ncbi:MAG: hypothetical protein OJF51_001851 [Nitrospira sp.]|nr:MAG: hypothetical protein OJF51_001851 [Nitrospira sp.]
MNAIQLTMKGTRNYGGNTKILLSMQWSVVLDSTQNRN